MNFLFVILLILLGFLLLIKGADFFVDGAAALALRLSLPSIVVGLTIVAFGTSAPELIVSIFASIKGNAEITLGNIIGSNLVNILLILGIAGVIHTIQTEKNTVWREIPFSLLAVFVLIFAANDMFLDGKKAIISRSDGLLMLSFFIIFLVYVFGISKTELKDKPKIKDLTRSKIVIYLFLGLFALILGGKLVVDNAINLALKLRISEKLISLTIVAIGTSLPELFTSTVAAYKKMPDIAIGNIVGSNIFNIFFILGISATIQPIPFYPVLNVDLAVLLVASLILFLTMFTGKRRELDRWESILLIVMYTTYMIYLLKRG